MKRGVGWIGLETAGVSNGRGGARGTGNDEECVRMD